MIIRPVVLATHLFAVTFVLGAWSTSARAGTVGVTLFELTNDSLGSNSIGVRVTTEDVGPNRVQMTAELLTLADWDAASGDIFALWFDVADAVNVAALNPTTPYEPNDLDISGFEHEKDAVGLAPWGSNPNINGIDAPFDSNYDVAFRFGSNGASPSSGFYPLISFQLVGLTSADLADQRFAARVMSIAPDGSSGKYGGHATVVPAPSAALSGLALLGCTLLRRRLA